MREFVRFPLDEFPVIALWRHEGMWTRQEAETVMGAVMRGVVVDRDPRFPHILALHRRQVGERKLRSRFGNANFSFFYVHRSCLRPARKPERVTEVAFDKLSAYLQIIGARRRIIAERIAKRRRKGEMYHHGD